MIRVLLSAVCALMLFGCADGRPGSSANIPIDPIPTCDELCGDVVCDIVGVEECAPECEVCETCETCEVCETCETCEECEVCEPEIVTVYLCKTWKWVCPKTFCHKTFGCDCHWEKQWVECDGPGDDDSDTDH